MPSGIISLAFIGASILFILSIRACLSGKRRNVEITAYMAVAFCNLSLPEAGQYFWLVLLLAGGALIGCSWQLE